MWIAAQNGLLFLVFLVFGRVFFFFSLKGGVFLYILCVLGCAPLPFVNEIELFIKKKKLPLYPVDFERYHKLCFVTNLSVKV
jgi:hypothetical protein